MDLEDIVLEQELLTNRRYLHHSRLGDVVVRRPTPAVEMRISEERRRIYHKDLQDTSILTEKQVMRLLEERGIWSKEDNARLQELASKSGEMMTRLEILGFENLSAFYKDLLACHDKLTDQFQDDPKLVEKVSKIFNMDTALDPKAMKALRHAAPGTVAVELLEDAARIRMQAELLQEFSTVKEELSRMSTTHAQFFGDTIEARATRTERLARVYHCVRKADGSPLWPKFENMLDEDPELVTWLSTQWYYFEHGVTPEQAKVLESHGFMERVTDTGDSSDDSPDRPESNSDGESQEKLLTTSSE
jgi:hypothetical protein